MRKGFTLIVMLMIIFMGLSLSNSQETKEIPGKGSSSKPGSPR